MASEPLEEDISLKSGSESAENVSEGNKLEKIHIVSSQLNFDTTQFFADTFVAHLDKWDFRLECTLMNVPKGYELPVFYVCLYPTVEEEKQLTISDIPLVHFKQSTISEDFFYHFGQRVMYRFPQTLNPHSHEDICITVSTIPYIESTDGTCELNINLREFPCHEESYYKYFKPRGKPYYLLTSTEGYLVKLNVFYVLTNFYAQVRFMAGPYDKKLPNHFPHLFYAIVKHEQDEEQSIYAEPVFKQFEQSKHGDWSCVYDYTITTYEAMAAKRVLTNDRLLVRFCIVPIV